MPMQLLKTSYTRAFLFRKHTWAEFEARIARRYEEQETAIDRHHSVLDEAALQTMIELNHRFALDGSDPNSYGGILWCLGLFDRPFQPEKPIIGTLRPRSTRSHAVRFDLETYRGRLSKPAASVSLRVAVVGAGMSGLVAARTIADHGHAVQVFEKEHVAGGRMSTRWMDEYAFDDGAQYFTVRDERFERWVGSWVESGIVKRWDGRIRVLRNGDIRPENREQIRYVGVPGMNSVTRHLSDSLSVRWDTCVGRIRKEGRAIVLFDEKGAQLGGYDALIVSTPPEQGLQLLSGVTPLVGRVAGVRMDPCWSVMLAFRDPLDLDADGLFIHGSALVWASRNSSKPGRGTADTWVLHAGSEWSSAHLELDPDEVAGQLTKTFFDAAGSPAVEPLLVSAHRWRHARTANPLEEECLWDPEEKIGVCGDWCCRSRIEGAYLSGAAVAGRILGAAGTWQESSR
jgi:hypothetical protein